MHGWNRKLGERSCSEINQSGPTLTKWESLVARQGRKQKGRRQGGPLRSELLSESGPQWFQKPGAAQRGVRLYGLIISTLVTSVIACRVVASGVRSTTGTKIRFIPTLSGPIAQKSKAILDTFYKSQKGRITVWRSYFKYGGWNHVGCSRSVPLSESTTRSMCRADDWKLNLTPQPEG